MRRSILYFADARLLILPSVPVARGTPRKARTIVSDVAVSTRAKMRLSLGIVCVFVGDSTGDCEPASGHCYSLGGGGCRKRKFLTVIFPASDERRPGSMRRFPHWQCQYGSPPTVGKCFRKARTRRKYRRRYGATSSIPYRRRSSLNRLRHFNQVHDIRNIPKARL
jgi:hypothetical protein